MHHSSLALWGCSSGSVNPEVYLASPDFSTRNNLDIFKKCIGSIAFFYCSDFNEKADFLLKSYEQKLFRRVQNIVFSLQIPTVQRDASR
jgi:hypothetical protein